MIPNFLTRPSSKKFSVKKLSTTPMHRNVRFQLHQLQWTTNKFPPITSRLQVTQEVVRQSLC